MAKMCRMRRLKLFAGAPSQRLAEMKPVTASARTTLGSDCRKLFFPDGFAQAVTFDETLARLDAGQTPIEIPDLLTMKRVSYSTARCSAWEDFRAEQD
jgi:hypothetical protein